jgi:trimeric autotransporter adhesin
LTNAVGIAASEFHSLALKADGTVLGWGGNQLGQATGVPTTYPHVTNGPVVLGGRLLSNVISVSAGDNFSVALERDGTVVAWGDNREGQTDVPAGLSNVVAVAAGVGHSLAVKSDGSLLGWGNRYSVPDGLTNIAAVALGCKWYSQAVALRRDGTLVAWRPSEQPSPVLGISNVVAIAAGAGHSLGLRRDGTVEGWGANAVGQATGSPTERDAPRSQVRIEERILTNVVAIAAHNEYSLALKCDGTVVAWGHPGQGTIAVPRGLSGVLAIAAGGGFGLAITTNAAPFADKK